MVDINPNRTLITLPLNELQSPREEEYDRTVLKRKPHKTELQAIYRRHSLNVRKQKFKCKRMEKKYTYPSKIKQDNYLNIRQSQH